MKKKRDLINLDAGEVVDRHGEIENDRLRQFLNPCYPGRSFQGQSEMGILETWKRHFKSVGRAFVVTEQKYHGYSCQVLWA